MVMRFEDEVQKIVIENGIASDKLNKLLERKFRDIYIKGYLDCLDESRRANCKEIQTEEVRKIVAYVDKHHESLK